MTPSTLSVRPAVAALFQPMRLGPYDLDNRMVMAPMTRSRATDGHVPPEMAATYYRQRASAGLIVTEATQVHPEGVGYPNTPGIHSDEQVAAWRRVTEAVHEDGGRIFLQLWHVGRISHPIYHDGEKPVAPSAIRPEGSVFTSEGMKDFQEPRALTTDEVGERVAWYRRGAERALEAGFDGVEVHGANGYLVDQFLRNGANRRTDRYGGSIENRIRFPLEVVDAVAEVWGPKRVGIRISPLAAFNDMSDSDPQALFAAFAQALGERDLGYLHIIIDDALPEDDPRSFDPLTLGDVFGGTVVAASGYDAETGAEVVEAGRADLVAYGRAFLANPDLPRRFVEGAELNEPDPDTFYGGDEGGYIDYPTLDEVESD